MLSNGWIPAGKTLKVIIYSTGRWSSLPPQQIPFKSFDQLWQFKANRLPIERSRFLSEKRRFWNLFCLKFQRHCTLLTQLNSTSSKTIEDVEKFIKEFFIVKTLCKFVLTNFVSRAANEFDELQDFIELCDKGDTVKEDKDTVKEDEDTEIDFDERMGF